MCDTNPTFQQILWFHATLQHICQITIKHWDFSSDTCKSRDWARPLFSTDCQLANGAWALKFSSPLVPTMVSSTSKKIYHAQQIMMGHLCPLAYCVECCKWIMRGNHHCLAGWLIVHRSGHLARAASVSFDDRNFMVMLGQSWTWEERQENTSLSNENAFSLKRSPTHCLRAPAGERKHTVMEDRLWIVWKVQIKS